MLPYLVQRAGISYATVSFVIALGLPLFGLLVLRSSARRVLCLGALMMFSGLLLLPPLCRRPRG